MSGDRKSESSVPSGPKNATPARRDLTEAQRDLLTRRLRGGAKPRTIDRADRTRPLPLSFMQEQLAVHQALHPESIAYNRPVVIRLRGSLDVAALERSLDDVARRQESLRTVIRFEDELPIQIVRPWASVSLPLIDVSRETDPAASAARAMNDEFRRPLVLQEQLLWRAVLVRSAEDEHLLLMTFHHLIFDHWSENVLFQDLSACYEAQCQGRSASLPDLPIHYADYSAWQRTQAGTPEFQRGVEFWQESLRDLPALELPTDRPRPEFPSEAGDSVPVTISPQIVSGLRRLGRQDDATLFVLLWAAWCALLHRESGQTDLVIGCPVAGRLRPEFEGLIGLFINTLPLRVLLSPGASFRDQVHSCRRQHLAAMQHQDVTLQQIVRQVIARTGRGGWAGFDAMFVYERFPEVKQSPAPVQFELLSYSLDVAVVDLSLELTEARDEVFGRLIFRRDLWDRSSVERLVSHFQRLLEGIVAAPQTPLDRLPLLSDDEQRRIVFDWNSTQRAYDSDQTLSQLFERQVARTPEAVAVRRGDHTLRYDELNQRANRLARRLQQAGARPETLVAVCTERSVDMIATLLAILKSGAAYLPLDPAYPPQRLSQLLHDAGVSLVVTEQKLLEHLPSENCVRLCLDADDLLWTDGPAENLDPAAGPDQLAYVIYTSGSTGKPKGVEILHRGAVNFLQAMQACPGLTAGVSTLAVTTITFDISVLEIFLPLIGGGAIDLVSRDVAVDGFRLKEAVERSQATVVQATPTTWRMLIEAGWKGNPALTLITGGESLTQDLAQALSSRGGLVWNMYGPTETTVWATVQLMKNSQQRITVGRPIANMQAWILDRYMQPVPIGVPGELYLGGEGVARGYRGRPDLTNERFLPNPFSRRSSDRIYKTGDLARFHSDGTIEHLGRIDQQIKLRGHRIEPGEIESVLCEHDSVAAATVVLVGTRIEDQQLAAYVVADPRQVSSQELKDLLRSHLPAYMVPATITFLEKFPLTSSGKIDRKALPAPERPRSAPEDSPSSVPQTSLESRLSQLWAEVLGIDRVGRDDNFFEVGGHSLLALRLAARMSGEFDRPVPVALFFQSPTVAAMAQALIDLQKSSSDGVVIELRPGDPAQPLFLLPPLGADPLFFRDLVQRLTAPHVIYTLDWHADTQHAPRRTLQQLARDCAKSIRQIQPNGPYRLGGYSFGGRLAFETACRLVDDGEQVSLLAIFDATPGAKPVLTLPERLLGCYRFLRNLPYWIYHDLFRESFSGLFGRFQRARRRFWKRLRIGSRAQVPSEISPQIDDLFDAELFPKWYQQRMQEDLFAVGTHRPQAYPLKVTLFRAQVRPLLHGYLTDLAWKQFALQGLEVHEIPGHHSSMMKSPHVKRLAEQLALVLNDGTRPPR